MLDRVAVLHVLYLALKAFIGDQTRLLQRAARPAHDCYGWRLRSRRRAVLLLMARRRSRAHHSQLTGAFNSATAMLESMADEESPIQSTTDAGKRKRDESDGNAELEQYVERLDERLLQHSRDMEETRHVNNALIQKMETNATALLGMVERLVVVMEAQSK